jgi:hypothetical protein
MYALYGILSRRRDERRQFASVVSCGFPSLMYICMESLFGVVTAGVATLGVDLRASYLVPSLSSCTLCIESSVGVSTLGDGL